MLGRARACRCPYPCSQRLAWSNPSLNVTAANLAKGHQPMAPLGECTARRTAECARLSCAQGNETANLESKIANVSDKLKYVQQGQMFSSVLNYRSKGRRTTQTLSAIRGWACAVG